MWTTHAACLHGFSSSVRENLAGCTDVLQVRSVVSLSRLKTGIFTCGTSLRHLCSVAVFFSVVLNLLVLVVMFRRRRKRLPLELYIIHLAAVDLCMAVLSYPLSVTSGFSHRWIFGRIGELRFVIRRFLHVRGAGSILVSETQ